MQKDKVSIVETVAVIAEEKEASQNSNMTFDNIMIVLKKVGSPIINLMIVVFDNFRFTTWSILA